MAAGFCLPDVDQLGSVPGDLSEYVGHYAGDDQLSGDPGRAGKPGEEFEDGGIAFILTRFFRWRTAFREYYPPLFFPVSTRYL